MLLDPRTSDLLLKPERPVYKKDHEVFRHYGYALDQPPGQPSRLRVLASKACLVLADHLIRLGLWLKKKNAGTPPPRASGLSDPA